MDLNPGSSSDLIKAAATSNRALAAYALMLIAWATIAFRVRRNQNLLKNLEKLPEKDRLETLRIEMDARPKNTTAEQWLRSRIHRYYFIGFLFLVAVIAFLSWLVVQAKRTSIAQAVAPTVLAYTQAMEAREKADADAREAKAKEEAKAQAEVDAARAKAETLAAEMGKLQKLALGEPPEFVLGVFGEPSGREDYKGLEEKPGQYANFLTFDYGLDLYSLRVFFYMNKIQSFTVILTDPTQKFKIKELGDKTFGEVSFAAFDSGEDAYNSPVVDKNSTAWGYVEIFYPQGPDGAEIVSIAYTATGAWYRTYEGLAKDPLEAFLTTCAGQMDSPICEAIDDDEDALVMNSQWNKEVAAGDLIHSEEVSYFRSEVFPNAYRVESNTGFMMQDNSSPPQDLPVLSNSQDANDNHMGFADELWYLAGESKEPCKPKCPMMGD